MTFPKSLLILALVGFAATLLFGLALPASAQIAGEQGLLSGLSDSCLSRGNCSLCDVISVINNVITLILGLVGSLALVAFIWGGFQIMAGGRFGGDQKEGIQKGRKIIEYAVIGLVLVFFSYTIVNFTINIIVASNKGELDFGQTANLVFDNPWADLCTGTE